MNIEMITRNIDANEYSFRHVQTPILVKCGLEAQTTVREMCTMATGDQATGRCVSPRGERSTGCPRLDGWQTSSQVC